MIQLGDYVRYTKTHEGHRCRVTGLIYRHDRLDELIKVAVHCQCGAELWLNPRDYREEG